MEIRHAVWEIPRHWSVDGDWHLNNVCPQESCWPTAHKYEGTKLACGPVCSRRQLATAAARRAKTRAFIVLPRDSFESEAHSLRCFWANWSKVHSVEDVTDLFLLFEDELTTVGTGQRICVGSEFIHKIYKAGCFWTPWKRKECTIVSTFVLEHIGFVGCIAPT